MTTADSILDQIDSTLGDYSLSDDAMRCAPDLPSRPAVRLTVGVDAREILIRRLVDLHGLTRLTARHAVLATERGDSSERADLVRAEAHAVAAEMAQRIRVAFQPMIEALRQLGESIKQLQQQVPELAEAARPARPRDRPAWQSPYGPARRRR